MRKTLIALVALLAAGIAHAASQSPVSLHGIVLGRTLPPACSFVTSGTPCVAERLDSFGNLTAYRIDGLTPIGATGEQRALVGVDAAGKIRAALMQAGVQREDFERAREKLSLKFGEPTLDGMFFAEWDLDSAVVEVYSPRSDVQAVFAFDTAFAPAGLQMVNAVYPNRMAGL